MFITSFTGPALAGASLPIAAVQREEQPKTEQRDDDPPPAPVAMTAPCPAPGAPRTAATAT